MSAGIPSRTLLLSFFLLASAAACAQWNLVKNPGLYSISAVQNFSAQSVFVGGSYGVYSSSDGGNSWSHSSQFDSISVANIFFNGIQVRDLYFMDEQTGFGAGFGVLGGNEVIIKTTDGAKTWSIKYYGTAMGFFGQGITGITFVNSQTGYASSFQGRMFKTVDGGENWNLLSTGVTNDLAGIQFFDTNNGISIGDKSIIKTTNSGTTWTTVNLPPAINFITAFRFLDAANGYLAANASQIYHTTDGGSTWSLYPMKANILKFSFIDANNVWAAGDNLYKTSDGGTNWFPEKRGTPFYPFQTISFLNASYAAAGDATGLVFRTSNGGIESLPAVAVTDAPAGALPGSVITLTGTNLDFVGQVIISGKTALFSSSGTTSLTVTVPADASIDERIELKTSGGSVFSPNVLSIARAPVLTNYVPDEGEEGVQVTLTGVNFDVVTGISFHDIPATFTITNNTSIVTTVPVGATTGSLKITSAYATISVPFPVHPPPSITSFFPTHGPRNTHFKIFGNITTETLNAKLNGLPLTDELISYTVNEIDYRGLPTGATTGKFTAVRQNGQIVTSPDAFVVEEGPGTVTLTRMTPSTGRLGELIKFTGTNFYSIDDIQLGGYNQPLYYSIVSDSVILLEIPFITESATFNFSFTDAVTRGIQTVTSGLFTLLPGFASPEIDSFSPASGPIGTKVTIKGRNFDGAYVSFNGTATTNTDLSPLDEVIVEVPALSTTGKIQVGNEVGKPAVSTTDFVVVKNYCVPMIFQNAVVHVDQLKLGNYTYTNPVTIGDEINYNDFTSQTIPVVAGQAIPYTITPRANTGLYNFTSTIYIDWNSDLDFDDAGELVTTDNIQVSNNSIRSIIPVPVNVPEGSLRLRVYVRQAFRDGSVPCNYADAVLNDGVVYDYTLVVSKNPNPGVPSFVSYFPDPIMWGAKTNLKGNNLQLTDNIFIDGMAAPFEYDSLNSELLIQIPENTLAGKVSVITGGGTITYFPDLYISPPPTLILFTPHEDSIGASVMISFESVQTTAIVTGIYFNEVLTDFTIVDGFPVAHVPYGATTGRIGVITDFGTYESMVDFTVLNAPSILSFSPTSGSIGQTVIITGANLSDITGVTLDGVAVDSYLSLSSTQLSIVVPAGATTGNFVVSSGGGKIKSGTRFTVLNQALPAPTNVVGTPRGPVFVNLEWKDNSNGETKFYIEYKASGSSVDFVRIDSVSSNVTSRLVRPPVCGGKGSFRVVAFAPGFLPSPSQATDVDSFIEPPFILGDRVLCDKDSTDLMAQSGYVSYEWNGIASGSTLHVTKAGNYSLSATDTAGCSYTVPVSVVQRSAPIATITVNGMVLTGSAGDTYVWLEDGTVLPDTGPELDAKSSGTYQVIVTKDECSTTSATVAVVVTGLDTRPSDVISIYPNPTTGKFTILTPGISGRLSVLNSLGVEVYHDTPPPLTEKVVVDMGAKPEGLYLLSFPVRGISKTYRFILTK